jgi:2-oxoglutarate ferredoxin oxidoreductase subunit alpha
MNTENNLHSKVFTVVIGGAAGDGIRETGTNISSLLHKLGFETFFSSNYPSLIRGGHNFSRISFSKERVFNDHRAIDVLIATNAESVKVHINDLKKDAIVFVESAYYDEVRDLFQNTVSLKMKGFAEEIQSALIARTSVALGAFCYSLGITKEKMNALIPEVFIHVGLHKNGVLAEKGYMYVEDKKLSKMEGVEFGGGSHGELIDANRAVAKGMVAAGLEYYIGYPMTPSTSILHYLAKVQKEHNLKVIQPEDEISVMNMALGISYAGKRVAVGTASGGFALMGEAFSFSAIAELPVVVVVSQRKGPATGVPTNTGQSDLRFVLHAGHGDFPRMVVVPGDAEEAYYAGAHALNLAWKYQVSPIILLDKHISESVSVADLDQEKIEVKKGKMFDMTEGGENYKRYKITEDGVSPLAFPGMKNVITKVTSYEHNEYGIGSEIPVDVQKMNEKRAKKLEYLLAEPELKGAVKTYGDKDSEEVIVFWGSTKGAVLEAAKYIEKPVKIVQILWAEPLAANQLSHLLFHMKKIICVEGNSGAQLAGLIREKTGIEVTDTILRYDALPFEPMELAEKINSLLAKQ